MFIHPHPNPVAFEVFGFGVHWYGLMYLAGFIIAWFIGRRLLRYDWFSPLRGIYLEDFITASALGVVIGGRLGYALFYNPAYYFQHPIEVFYLWEGGMSFHGGLIGVIVALLVVAKLHALPAWAHEEQKTDAALQSVTSTKHTFLRLFDFAAVLTPPGLGLGRLANFINAELPGRVASAELPWAVVFGYPDNLPRHPSPLYQMLLEGGVIAVLMLWLVRRPHPPGWLAGVFLSAYAVARFGIEFFREPDAHLGLLFINLSMGQLLSLPMLLIGLAMIYRLQLARMWRQRLGTAVWWQSLKQFLYITFFADAEEYEKTRRFKKQQFNAEAELAAAQEAESELAATQEAESEPAQKDEAATRSPKKFLYRLLFEEYDATNEEDWQANEKFVADTYEGEEDENYSRGFGGFIKRFFADESDDDDDGDWDYRLTRRQKRRMKKKKRGKKR